MTLRPTCMEVNLDNLRHNYRTLRNWVRPGCDVIGVIKGEAYGMGMTRVAEALIRAGCRHFAVATPDEAILLRERGIGQKILVLGPSPSAAAPEYLRLDITPAITDPGFAEALNALSRRQGRRTCCHLKLDTGMGRIGFTRSELKKVLPRLARFEHLAIKGAFTHFSTADEKDDSYTRAQFSQFISMTETLREQGFMPRHLHACNSAAALRFPEMHLDAVRPGLVLYGMLPSEECPFPGSLRPVFRLVTHIALLRDIPSGRDIGYGRKYTTPGPRKIAVLPIGYHDGYRRALSGTGKVLVRGQRAPVVGNICMDQTMIDVTSIGDIRQGDEAVLIGNQGGTAISPEEIADWLGTINYEIPQLVAPRVPRQYRETGA